MKFDLERNSLDEIKISPIIFDKDEEAIAIGFGADIEEAKNNFKWFDKTNIPKDTYLCDKTKPFITLRKKKNNGELIEAEKCINFLEIPKGSDRNPVNKRFINF